MNIFYFHNIEFGNIFFKNKNIFFIFIINHVKEQFLIRPSLIETVNSFHVDVNLGLK